MSSEGDAKRAPKLTLTYYTRSAETAGIANDTYYYIRNFKTQKYLTIPDGYYYVDQEAYTGGSNQLWKVHYNGDGTYGLASAARSGYYMYAGVETEGGSIEIDNPTGSLPNDCRMWIIPTAKGNFRIASREIGQFRALTGGRLESTSVAAYNYTAADDQQWVFVKCALSLSAAKIK